MAKNAALTTLPRSFCPIPKFFRTKLRKWWRIGTFFRVTFFLLQKVPLDIENATLKTRRKHFAKIQSGFRKLECKKNNPAKDSSGHLESSFHKPAKNFSSTVKKDFARTPNVIKKCYSPKISSGHVENNFNKIVEKFPRSPHFSARTPTVLNKF